MADCKCSVGDTNPYLLELMWAAGFLEGEGTFRVNRTRVGGQTYLRPVISAAQKQREPLDRLLTHFQGSIYQESSGIYKWALSGTAAVALMRDLYSELSMRRRAQVDVAISEWERDRSNGLAPRACKECGLDFVPIRYATTRYCSRHCGTKNAQRAFYQREKQKRK